MMYFTHAPHFPRRLQFKINKRAFGLSSDSESEVGRAFPNSARCCRSVSLLLPSPVLSPCRHQLRSGR